MKRERNSSLDNELSKIQKNLFDRSWEKLIFSFLIFHFRRSRAGKSTLTAGNICGAMYAERSIAIAIFESCNGTMNLAQKESQAMSAPPTEEISRVSIANLTPRTFQRYYRGPGIPVIIEGLLDGEPVWNLDYLSQVFGNREFLLRNYGKERYQKDKRQWDSIGSGIRVEAIGFLDYAALVRSGEARDRDLYMAKCSLAETPLANNQHLNDIGTKLGFKKPMSTLNLWAGPGGHVEALHYDAFDGTLVQLAGCKKVLLFSPSQLSNLYPFPISIHFWKGMKLRAWFSQVYPERPDFQSFPRLKEALKHKKEVILQPGDILFIPCGWWHEVSALGDELVCSVNRFWAIAPKTRQLTSWSAWRTYLAFLFAFPNLLAQLFLALFRKHPGKEIRKILHTI